MLLLALLHKVDAAPVVIVNGEELVVLCVVPLTLRLERMRFAHCAVKRAADREHRIADLFGAQPPPIEAPEKIIIRVNLCITRVISSVELIGVRKHDYSVHRLQRPAALNELRGKVIEQLWMCWGNTARAEVVRRRDQSFAEMV